MSEQEIKNWMDNKEKARQDLSTWLQARQMGRQAAALSDIGYNDLESVKRCSDDEAMRIIDLFAKPGLRLKMRLLLEEVRPKGDHHDHHEHAHAARAMSPPPSRPTPVHAADESAGPPTQVEDSEDEAEAGSDSDEDERAHRAKSPKASANLGNNADFNLPNGARLTSQSVADMSPRDAVAALRDSEKQELIARIERETREKLAREQNDLQHSIEKEVRAKLEQEARDKVKHK